MARTLGSRNKNSDQGPATFTMTTEERLHYLANLIVDKILSDQRSDQRPSEITVREVKPCLTNTMA
jgi:hypothetical protein